MKNEEAELARRYNAINQAPLVALWKNLPGETELPAGAVRPQPIVRCS